MKQTLITLCLIFTHSLLFSCSFAPISFCQTVNDESFDNVILRGYFSDQLSNGLVFTRLETIQGNEERDEIKVWDYLPFDCNGIHERLAAFLGNMNEEIIITVSPIDSLIFEGETLEDYRVPEGIWWETHSLKVVGDSVFGNLFYSPIYETLHYDDFIEDVILNSTCVSTSNHNPNLTDIKVYPTLSKEYIHISSPNLNPSSRVTVFTNLGKPVLSQKISSTIDIGMLARGMYILRVETPDNQFYQEKFIKI